MVDPIQFKQANEAGSLPIECREVHVKFYIQYRDESVEEAIAAHDTGAYDSITEACEEVFMHDDMGTLFVVIDEKGKVHFDGITTHDGVMRV